MTEAGSRHELRVYYEDTDFSGLVYHASYLRFLERGRTEWLRALGLHQGDIHAGAAPYVFVVRRMTIDWLKPARMDDWLAVETRLAELRGASAELAQTIWRGPERLLAARVAIACVSSGRPRRLPEVLRASVNPNGG